MSCELSYHLCTYYMVQINKYGSWIIQTCIHMMSSMLLQLKYVQPSYLQNRCLTLQQQNNDNPHHVIPDPAMPSLCPISRHAHTLQLCLFCKRPSITKIAASWILFRHDLGMGTWNFDPADFELSACEPWTKASGQTSQTHRTFNAKWSKGTCI